MVVEYGAHTDSEMSSTTRVRAAVVISAIGFLHEINISKDLINAGLQNFQNDWWHSAKWRHDVSLPGKRVGIIGMGSSAFQIIPEISQDSSTHVIQFCRRPNWMVPRVSSISDLFAI